MTRVSTSALRLHTGLKGLKVRGAMDDERIDSLLTTVMDLGKQVLAMECFLHYFPLRGARIGVKERLF